MNKNLSETIFNTIFDNIYYMGKNYKKTNLQYLVCVFKQIIILTTCFEVELENDENKDEASHENYRLF